MATGNCIGIYVTGDMTINGGTIDSTGKYYTGIDVGQNLTINGGAITSSGTNGEAAINAGQIITINGGTVEVSAVQPGSKPVWEVRGIKGARVIINNGTVLADTTVSREGVGIESTDTQSYTEINGGKVTAIGLKKAFSNNVKNKIGGTGWTNTEGTEGKADIAASETGQALASYKKVMFPPEHTHAFTYSAEGATITATCTADKCYLPPSSEGGTDHVATLTIAAPLHTAYGDGKEAAAQITDTNSIKGDATVSYFEATKSGDTYTKKSETALAAAPTDAGDYIAEITLGEANASHATASVGYTIAKADPTANAPTGLTATYGDTLADVSLEGKNPEGNTEGSWAWVDSTQSVGNVVSPAASFKADFTPTDADNYNSVSNVDVTVTVNKEAAQTLADVEVPLLYTATSVSASVADEMPTDAGTLSYTAGDASKTGSVTVTDFAVDSDGVVTATLSGGAVDDTITLPVTIGSTNYEDSAVNVVITLTAKADAGVSIEGVPEALTYGDEDFTLTGSVTAAGTGTGNWAWSTSDDTVFQITSDGVAATVKILKVGSATITAEYESDTTIGTAKTASITVGKKALTVKALDKNINVGGEVPDLSNPVLDKDYSVDGLVGEETLATPPTLSYASEPDITKPGTYAITAGDATASDNYDIGYQEGTLKITAKEGKPVAVVKGIAKGKTSLKFTWNTVKGAKNYEIWMTTCKNGKYKKLKTFKAGTKTFTKKKLKKNAAYKFYVVAKDASGKVICKSYAGHSYTGNVRGKYTNAKSLKVSIQSYTLKKGGTAKIKATQTKVKKNRKLSDHANLLRYKSSNTSVAKVDSNGKITAVNYGNCSVYVQTVNGIWKTVTVTVE